MLALSVCFPQPVPQHGLQVCRVKITFGFPPNNWFVSTKTNSIKCFVNWIPLNTHVRFNQTQPYLKRKVAQYGNPPAPMNCAKIFQGWSLRYAPGVLVHQWYKTFLLDHVGWMM